MDLDLLGVFLLLIGLELVLGVDNILVISIVVSRLPEADRGRARVLGLALAFVARIVVLFIIVSLAGMTAPILWHFSVRDFILLGGGLFLLWKAASEIHHTVELRHETATPDLKGKGVRAAITQIVLLDIVFSVDSVVTAVGLTDVLWVIISAVVVSFGALLLVARPVGDFILRHPALKILALSFLITIGVTIFLEGLHQHMPKAYIYLPMGFALFVELLQMRYYHNKERKQDHPQMPDVGVK